MLIINAYGLEGSGLTLMPLISINKNVVRQVTWKTRVICRPTDPTEIIWTSFINWLNCTLIMICVLPSVEGATIHGDFVQIVTIDLLGEQSLVRILTTGHVHWRRVIDIVLWLILNCGPKFVRGNVACHFVLIFFRFHLMMCMIDPLHLIRHITHLSMYWWGHHRAEPICFVRNFLFIFNRVSITLIMTGIL